ncbi:hypothetical protein [Prosthecobacter sp.]|uniref:hypothetical protein n=1 Tax=Prosthecobacter sp. TaxID=1965333 RepID=UPI0037C8ABB1
MAASLDIAALVGRGLHRRLELLQRGVVHIRSEFLRSQQPSSKHCRPFCTALFAPLSGNQFWKSLYLSGNAGYAYVALAILFWAISQDLQRYQPLVRVSGWIMVIAGPAYLSIDLQCPLPLWWVLMDSLSCLLIGLALLWACPLAKKTHSADC